MWKSHVLIVMNVTMIMTHESELDHYQGSKKIMTITMYQEQQTSDL